MEYRFINKSPIEIRQNGNEIRIAGYAALYDSPSPDREGWIETVKRGAFDQSLSEVAEGKRDVVCRMQHEGGLNLLARTSLKSGEPGSLELKSDSKGLHYVASLVPTQRAKDIYEMIRSGLISQSSFAFTLPDSGDSWDYRSTPAKRSITKVNLIDVAPVDEAYYPATSVAARSFHQAENDYYKNCLLELKERIKQLS